MTLRLSHGDRDCRISESMHWNLDSDDPGSAGPPPSLRVESQHKPGLPQAARPVLGGRGDGGLALVGRTVREERGK